MSIAIVNAGGDVKCADLGWPLDALGPDAWVWINPLPSKAYKNAIAEASGRIKLATDSPAFYATLQRALPWVYAASVMTQMRGIRLEEGADVLEDTQENRRAVLRACPLLAERVYQWATKGPAGLQSWREVAVRHRSALREVQGLLSLHLDAQQSDPLVRLREIERTAHAALTILEGVKIMDETS